MARELFLVKLNPEQLRAMGISGAANPVAPHDARTTSFVSNVAPHDAVQTNLMPTQGLQPPLTQVHVPQVQSFQTQVVEPTTNFGFVSQQQQQQAEQIPVPVPNPTTPPAPQGPAALNQTPYIGNEIPVAGNWGDVCGSFLCCPEKCSYFEVGAEGTFLAPISEPRQRVILTDLVTNQQFIGESNPGFGSGIRTWVGFQSKGWGYRARYWHFGNDLVVTQPVTPQGDQPGFIETYGLRGNTLDLETTQRFVFCRQTVHTSFGARWASLTRSAAVAGFGTLGNGVDLSGLAFGANELEGIGLTTSIGASRPLACKCGWTAFWNLRGSILWADSVVTTLADATAATSAPVAVATSRNKASASADHSQNVFIADVQIGLEYEKCLTCMPATFFFRTGFEFQHWETGNLLSRSNSFAFLQGGPPAFGGRVDAQADAHDGDLSLIGFFVGGGLRF